MAGYSSSEDHQPLFTVQGHPVYATTLLIGIFTASMLFTTLILAGGNTGSSAQGSALVDFLAFSSSAVRAGAIWKLVTYAFVNPPSVQFVIDMVMLWWFGREVERFFGRKLFLRFYGMVILIPSVLLTFFGWNSHIYRIGQPGSFAVFLAFATLYPNALLIFNILAKWFAIVIVAIFTLMALADRNWVELVMLWSNVTLGYVFVRYEQGHITLPALSLKRLTSWHKRPKLRVVRDEPARKAPAASTQSEPMDEIDPLLDKIARSGLASLTPAERERLQKVSKALSKKQP